MCSFQIILIVKQIHAITKQERKGMGARQKVKATKYPSGRPKFFVQFIHCLKRVDIILFIQVS